MTLSLGWVIKKKVMKNSMKLYDESWGRFDKYQLDFFGHLYDLRQTFIFIRDICQTLLIRVGISQRSGLVKYSFERYSYAKKNCKCNQTNL